MTQLPVTCNKLSGRRAGRCRGGDVHLWHAADGTGLHARAGELTVDESTGRLCCHLCGRWCVSLGSHVRAHGHTAASYRAATGLCTGEPLTAAPLSQAISARQARSYHRNEQLREALAEGAALLRTKAGPRQPARSGAEPPQRVARRRAALQAGRETTEARRRRDLARRLAGLGFPTLADYLRAAYAAGSSLEAQSAATGLGRGRLRAAHEAAGVPVLPSGVNTPAGRRSRAVRAERAAARRVGTEDLHAWLRERRDAGWSLTRLAAAVGHSTHWVRWRLADPATSCGAVPSGI